MGTVLPIAIARGVAGGKKAGGETAEFGCVKGSGTSLALVIRSLILNRLNFRCTLLRPLNRVFAACLNQRSHLDFVWNSFKIVGNAEVHYMAIPYDGTPHDFSRPGRFRALPVPAYLASSNRSLGAMPNTFPHQENHWICTQI